MGPGLFLIFGGAAALGGRLLLSYRSDLALGPKPVLTDFDIGLQFRVPAEQLDQIWPVLIDKPCYLVTGEQWLASLAK